MTLEFDVCFISVIAISYFVTHFVFYLYLRVHPEKVSFNSHVKKSQMRLGQLSKIALALLDVAAGRKCFAQVRTANLLRENGISG